MFSEFKSNIEFFKNNLVRLGKLKEINSKYDENCEYLKKSELNIDLSNSGESCAQNYCQINTQLIESFECFDKSIDNNKQFKCFWPKCQYNTNNKNTLRRHQQNIHSNERQFVCDFNECDKTYKYKERLILHRRIHHLNKLFKCDYNNCNKSYKNLINLREHKKRVHLNIRYRCDWKDCNKTFSYKSYLYSHKKSFHLNERKYVCDWSECKKRFTTKQDLFRHKRIHSGEKPFKCGINGCDKSFRLLSNLKVHKKRIHLLIS